MAFQLTRAGLRPPEPGELASLASEFSARHLVRLPVFLDRRLVAWLQQRMTAARWETLVHDDIQPPAIDLMLDDPVARGVLMAMTASSELFRLLETLTCCEPIGCYAFRVYRMDPGDRHHDTWHGDDNGNRLLTLTINVGLEPFEGGELELRERRSERMIESAANTGPGDALLFRIAPGLEHRVCGVTGHTPKFAVAGWFQREPKMDLAAVLGR